MDVFTLAASLTLDDRKYNEGIDNAKKKSKSLASKIGGGLKTAAKVGAVAIGATATAMTALGIRSIKTGMEFDKSFSQVAATLGTSTDKIQDLRDFAMKMGEETAFTATEASDALNYMALAGYDAKKSMQMLPNVLNLAAAGNIDLASASDMVTDAQSALGLSVKQTKVLVDQMAKASSKTNTSVGQLGEGILTVGGTARSLKGGTQELATALGLLADNGIKGAEGGTKLRNIMISLTPKSKKAAEAMEAIGLKAYDAQGNMRSLEDIFTDLNKNLSKMSTEQRTKALSKIFNKQDLKAVNALLNTNKKRWQEVYQNIGNAQGAADKMAKTQLDNLAGDVTLLKSAFDGVKLSVSDKLSPTFRKFVQSATSGLQKISKGIRENGIEGGFKAFAKAFSDMNKKVNFGGMITKLITSLTKAVPSFVSAAKDIVISLATTIGKNADKVVTGFATMILDTIDVLTKPETIKQLATAATTLLTNFATGLVDSLDVLTNPEMLEQLATAATTLVTNLATGLVDSVGLIIDRLPEILDNIVNGLLKQSKVLISGATDLISNLADKLPDLVDSVIDVLPTVITNIADAISENLPSLIEGVTDLITKLAEKLPTMIGDILTKLPSLISKIIQGLIYCLPLLIQGGIDLVIGIVKNLPTIISNLIENIPNIISAIIDAFANGEIDFVELGKSLMLSVLKGMVNFITSGIFRAIPNLIMKSVLKLFGVKDEDIDIMTKASDLATDLSKRKINTWIDTAGNASGGANQMAQKYRKSETSLQMQEKKYLHRPQSSKSYNVTINNPSVRSDDDIDTLLSEIDKNLRSLAKKEDVAYGY